MYAHVHYSIIVKFMLAKHLSLFLSRVIYTRADVGDASSENARAWHLVHSFRLAAPANYVISVQNVTANNTGGATNAPRTKRITGVTINLVTVTP